jgi:hypothetical protein
MKRAPDRLVIGVTGHRRLGDEGPLGFSIDAVLDELERRAGESGAKPAGLTVLSPLAEGADRLVARRVLARPGGELEAVLPMSEKKYARDFAAPGSEAEFRGLLARARSVRRLRGPRTRSGAYAAAGRWVVDHCDVLVALWDGRPEDGPGGTAEIVRYAKKKGRTVAWVRPEDGHVVGIDGRFGTRL